MISRGQETREVRGEPPSRGLDQWRGEAALVDCGGLHGQRRAEGPVATQSMGRRWGGAEVEDEEGVVNTEELGDRIRERRTVKLRCWT